MVRLKDIIGIFHIGMLDSPQSSRCIELAKERNAVEIVEVGELKSFVVTDEKIFFSPISSVTLKKRAQFLDPTEKMESDPKQDASI